MRKVARRAAMIASSCAVATALAGCGGGGDGGATPSPADRRTADSQGAPSGGRQPAGPSQPPLSTSGTAISPGDQPSTGNPAPGSDAFCRQVADTLSGALAQAPGDLTSPDALRRQVDITRERSEQTIAVAPAELRPHLRTLSEVSRSFTDQLAAVGYEYTRIDPRWTDAYRTPAVQEANRKVAAYLEESCGIDPLGGVAPDDPAMSPPSVPG